MKKFLNALIVAGVVLCLVGCNRSEREKGTTTATASQEETSMQDGDFVSFTTNTMTVGLDKLKISDELISEYVTMVNRHEFVPGDTLSVEILELNDEQTWKAFKTLFELTFSYYELDETQMSLTFSGYNNPSVEADFEKRTVTITMNAYVKE